VDGLLDEMLGGIYIYFNCASIRTFIKTRFHKRTSMTVIL
jgi:hypothetical protein